MFEYSGSDIVKDALALRRAQPKRAALEVLDQVTEPRRGADPTFEVAHSEYTHHIYPPSPFAELLREAFDPSLDQADLQLMVTRTDDPETLVRVAAIRERWDKVIDAYSVRFELWSRVWLHCG